MWPVGEMSEKHIRSSRPALRKPNSGQSQEREETAKRLTAKRISERARAFKFAIVRFGRDAEMTCIIRNLSASGVGVTLDSVVALPQTILLIVPQYSINMLATVRWQRGREAGVQFIVPSSKLAELR
ncbi:MAG: PilZ domain-containing protein [Parvularculaceae bacterium]